VAAHGRENEWRHAVAAPVLNDALDNSGNVGDTPAADADPYPRARLQPRRKAALLELAPRLAPYVSQPEIGKILADEEQAGWEHRQQNSVILRVVTRRNTCTIALT
jgi:hypothetical protein